MNEELSMQTRNNLVKHIYSIYHHHSWFPSVLVGILCVKLIWEFYFQSTAELIKENLKRDLPWEKVWKNKHKYTGVTSTAVQVCHQIILVLLEWEPYNQLEQMEINFGCLLPFFCVQYVTPITAMIVWRSVGFLGCAGLTMVASVDHWLLFSTCNLVVNLFTALA